MVDRWEKIATRSNGAEDVRADGGTAHITGVAICLLLRTLVKVRLNC